MPTRFLNRIPIVASPKFLLADVFGPSEAAAAKLSLANLARARTPSTAIHHFPTCA